MYLFNTFLTFFDVSILTWFKQINFSTYPKKTKILYQLLSCSCRGSGKDVGTIDLQVTYNANDITAVCKARVRLLHNNRKFGSAVPTSIVRHEWQLIFNPFSSVPNITFSNSFVDVKICHNAPYHFSSVAGCSFVWNW